MCLSLMQATDAPPTGGGLLVIVVMFVVSMVIVFAMLGVFKSKEQIEREEQEGKEQFRRFEEKRQEEARLRRAAYQKAQERELFKLKADLLTEIRQLELELEEAAKELGKQKMSPALRVLRELQLAEKQARLKAMTTPMSEEEIEELNFQLSVMSEQIAKQKKKLGAVDRLKSKL